MYCFALGVRTRFRLLRFFVVRPLPHRTPELYRFRGTNRRATQAVASPAFMGEPVRRWFININCGIRRPVLHLGAQPFHLCFNPFKYRIAQPRGKASGNLLGYGFDDFWRGVNEPLNFRFEIDAHGVRFGDGVPMPPLNGGHAVVRILCAQGHRHFYFLPWDFVCAFADDRPRGQDVVQWGESEAAVWFEKEAEVLGVSVGRGEQRE